MSKMVLLTSFLVVNSHIIKRRLIRGCISYMSRPSHVACSFPAPGPTDTYIGWIVKGLSQRPLFKFRQNSKPFVPAPGIKMLQQRRPVSSTLW